MFTVTCTCTRLYNFKEFIHLPHHQKKGFCVWEFQNFQTFMVMENVFHVFYGNFLERIWIWSLRWRVFRGCKGKLSVYFDYQNTVTFFVQTKSLLCTGHWISKSTVVESLNLVTFSTPAFVNFRYFGGLNWHSPMLILEDQEREFGDLLNFGILRLLSLQVIKKINCDSVSPFLPMQDPLTHLLWLSNATQFYSSKGDRPLGQ